jgi:hypothetical protein
MAKRDWRPIPARSSNSLAFLAADAILDAYGPAGAQLKGTLAQGGPTLVSLATAAN